MIHKNVLPPLALVFSLSLYFHIPTHMRHIHQNYSSAFPPERLQACQPGWVALECPCSSSAWHLFSSFKVRCRPYPSPTFCLLIHAICHFLYAEIIFYSDYEFFKFRECVLIISTPIGSSTGQYILNKYLLCFLNTGREDGRRE